MKKIQRRIFTHRVRVFAVAALIATGIAGALVYSQISNARYITQHFETGSLLSPELCLPFERFDTQEYTCIAECKGATACRKLEDNYRRAVNVLSLEDLKLYYGFYETPYEHPFGEDAADRYQEPLALDAVAYTRYSIADGELDQEVETYLEPIWTEEPEELWELFKAILPSRFAPYVDEFILLDDPQWTLSLTAWAAPIDAGHSWEIAINSSGIFSPGGYLVYRGDTTHTLIHELGHVITLNASQIDYSLGFECETISLPEGCAKRNSYIAQFVKEFWPDQYGGVEAPSGVFEAGSFVTGYAADNPAEDLAETWTAFVIYPKPRGNSVAEQKILSLYRYPELVAARTEIRSNLGKIR